MEFTMHGASNKDVHLLQGWYTALAPMEELGVGETAINSHSHFFHEADKYSNNKNILHHAIHQSPLNKQPHMKISYNGSASCLFGWLF